jgi:hypothetical protein
MPRLAVGFVFVTAALLAVGGYRVFKPHGETATAQPQDKPIRDAFAADRDPVVTEAAPFDAKRAMEYLQSICRIGPRMSATPGMKKQQELIQKHFEGRGLKVQYQYFTARQVSQVREVEMANMIIAWRPEARRRVVLCSHYDTRPIADQEENQRKWHEPFLSANDGGSGVALLMELANHLKGLKLEVGVDFVLFDGEEYIFDPQRDKYFLGSEHFAQMYARPRPEYRYVAAVLLDMVAGKQARFPLEQHSWFDAQPLAEDLWKIAAELKCDAFQDRMGDSVLDDHIALNRAGIPAVDIIDFHYPHWHRLTDVPANCSPEGMTQVALVLSVWLQRVK